MKLKDLPRYHIFRFVGDNCLYLKNEGDKKEVEWHRVYKDGRTNLEGKYSYDPYWLNKPVHDLGDIYDWMKRNHPIRYKRENWEASKPKKGNI